MNFATVNHISECFIKPKYEVEDSKHTYYLAPIDLSMLSFHYIQNGLLFNKPSHSYDDEEYSAHKFLESLKESLSLTLVHFYPLAGLLATQTNEDRHESFVYVDCNKGPGARFIHATLGMTVSDILSPNDVPLVVRSFFDHNEAVNHDGHVKPLLSVQVTELLDGVFIGCSMNHAVADGTSYWHFWNIWSEIHRANDVNNVSILSRLPVHKRWFLDGYGPTTPLPFTHPDEFITRYQAPQLREKIFHFSSKSIASLKAKANKESNTNKISSFQALCSLVWRSMVRANRLPYNQVTFCSLLSNNRPRLKPSLSPYYFGNSINAITTTTTVSELLEHDLGWTGLLIHESVVNHTDKVVRDFTKRWLQSPFVYKHATLYDLNSITFENSPRFDMYGNEFGLGKPIAVRNGQANKSVGVVNVYPGYEGDGSVDMEICLPPDSMSVLELDEELIAAVLLH